MLFVLSMDCSFARADEQEVAHTTRGQTTDRFEHLIGEAAQRFAIPVHWIQSILRIESAGDAHAKSDKGAIGLMQIMPATWVELRQRYALGNDPYDPHDNILAGAAYLRELFDRYGFPGAFAAYNTGPARYEQHLAGVLLPVETQAYVRKISAELDAASASNSSADARLWSASPIFPAHPDRIGAAERQLPAAIGLHAPSMIIPKPTAIFVARSDARERR
ncbi:lytic transglycosylase domain-containing protein [Bradyrhizobium barranii]|uniref:Lytic transglycosylase domain-containing protein n=1 Tax=Bradyrhizobium barranii TaxID=2992140 RepID=A0ABY3QXB3_9BRAD|nr:lytic transglycosylase domain-containing protein [Bradyrhizobium japonicum]UFW90502.1 lytic transglycosylase domain-containing protein [Bradyrhizobium japonicum]